MKKQKKDDVIAIKKTKLIIAVIMITILVIAFLIRLTPLVAIYQVNFITALILKNTFNIIFVATILLVLYTTQKKMILQKFEELERK